MASDELWFLSDKVKAYVTATPSKSFPIFETEEIKIIKTKEKTCISVQEGENYARYEVKGGLFEVEWKVTIKNGELFKVPRLRTYGGESRGSVTIYAPDEILRKLGFIEEEKIGLPEPIIKLPIPKWVSLETNWPRDWPNCEMCVAYCFRSEAEQMVFEFKKELEENLKI